MLLGDLSLQSFDDINNQDLKFHTLFVGKDPMEKSRILIKKIVEIPVDLGKYGGAS